jgi:hypothetical protein
MNEIVCMSIPRILNVSAARKSDVPGDRRIHLSICCCVDVPAVPSVDALICRRIDLCICRRCDNSMLPVTLAGGKMAARKYPQILNTVLGMFP